MSLKNPNDTIGNRIRDLPVCSVVSGIKVHNLKPQRTCVKDYWKRVVEIPYWCLRTTCQSWRRRAKFSFNFTAEATNHACGRSILPFVRSHKRQNTFNTNHSGFKLCSLMWEDGWEQPKPAAQSVGCNKFAVFDSNKLLLIFHGMDSLK
jgi:hypothetical protein